jgi:hypothetical protein
MRLNRFLAAIACIAVLAACSSPESDFKKAEQANTEAAFQQFLDKHAEGPLADQARQRLTDMHDERDWAVAEQAGTTDALRTYLQAYPSGLHATAADAQLQDLERRAAWQAADQAGSKEALEAFIAQYPGSPETAEAQQRLAALAPPPPPPAPPRKSTAAKTGKPAQSAAAKAPAGGYHVQLGAFSSNAMADQQRKLLAQKYGKLVPGPLAVAAPPAGAKDKLFRVRSAGTSEAEAARVCKALKAKGQACLVIPP